MIVIISPHYDDSIFSLGGLISLYKEQKKSISIINVFTKSNGICNNLFQENIYYKSNLNSYEYDSLRKLEDENAMNYLQVDSVYDLSNFEVPFRLSGDEYIVHTIDDLASEIFSDEVLNNIIFEQILNILKNIPVVEYLLLPIGLAKHADHMCCSLLGDKFKNLGYTVYFYPEYPYLLNYDFFNLVQNHTLKFKLSNYNIQQWEKSSLFYPSQSRLNIKNYSISKSIFLFSEIFEFEPFISNNLSFKKFILLQKNYFKFIPLINYLPSGRGDLLDLGCGNEIYKQKIESLGYTWYGLDKYSVSKNITNGDMEDIPFANSSFSVVFSSLSIQYANNPLIVISEVKRILKPGGLFLCCFPYLEPQHGKNIFSISYYGMKQILETNGFKDIKFIPGINGFTLFIWTYLRKLKIGFLFYFFFPFYSILIFIKSILFLLSHLNKILFNKHGHWLNYINNQYSFDFAGHIIFIARISKV